MSTNNLTPSAPNTDEVTDDVTSVDQAAAVESAPAPTEEIAVAVTQPLPPLPTASPDDSDSAESLDGDSLDPDENGESMMDFGAILAAHEETHRSEICENEVV